MDDATIEELKAKYPDEDLHLLSGGGVEAIARAPRAKEANQFRDLLFNEKTRPRAMERLVRACVVWPSAAELGKLLDQKPLLAEKWAEKLQELAGGEVEIEVKKL
jgi:hypothetical protein